MRRPKSRSNCRLFRLVSTQNIPGSLWRLFAKSLECPLAGPSSEQVRLVAAAQAIVNMVDSQEGEASSSKSLVERLEEAPKKIIDFMMATSKNYLSHMLAVVKSYWPQHNLAPVAKGIAADCSDQEFLSYCKEIETIAEAILKNLAE